MITSNCATLLYEAPRGNSKSFAPLKNKAKERIGQISKLQGPLAQVALMFLRATELFGKEE